MAGDITITPAATVPQAQPHRPDSAPPPAVSQPAAAAPQSGAGSTSTPTAPPLNPSLHLDPALNLVVLQFFNAKGDVVQSIPSQKQLEAYRLEAGPTGREAQQPVSKLL